MTWYVYLVKRSFDGFYQNQIIAVKEKFVGNTKVEIKKIAQSKESALRNFPDVFFVEDEVIEEKKEEEVSSESSEEVIEQSSEDSEDESIGETEDIVEAVEEVIEEAESEEIVVEEDEFTTLRIEGDIDPDTPTPIHVVDNIDEIEAIDNSLEAKAIIVDEKIIGVSLSSEIEGENNEAIDESIDEADGEASDTDGDIDSENLSDDELDNMSEEKKKINLEIQPTQQLLDRFNSIPCHKCFNNEELLILKGINNSLMNILKSGKIYTIGQLAEVESANLIHEPFELDYEKAENIINRAKKFVTDHPKYYKMTVPALLNEYGMIVNKKNGNKPVRPKPKLQEE